MDEPARVGRLRAGEALLMAWVHLPTSLYSPESAGSTSGQSSSAESEQSVMSSGTHTLKPFSCPGCETDNSTTPRYGTTSKPSTPGHSAACWISSLAVSRASQPAPQENGRGYLTIAGFSPSSLESFAKLAPDSSWLKTSQGYCQLMMDGLLEKFSESWPGWATMRNGICFLLPKPERHTSATESGSWENGESEAHNLPFPTPSSTAYGSSGNGTGNNKASRGRPSLETMASKNRWPTPTVGDSRSSGMRDNPGSNANPGTSLTDAVVRKRWATPRAVDGEKPAGMSTRRQKAGKKPDSLHQQIAQPAGGQLNPTWVEWLMGWPLGWTVLDAQATEWFRSKASRRGGSSKKLPRKI